MRILNRDIGNTEQATRFVNNGSSGSEILAKQGSVPANVGVCEFAHTSCANLDGKSSASIQRILEDSGSVPCSDTEHECIDKSKDSENSDSDSVCSDYNKK